MMDRRGFVGLVAALPLSTVGAQEAPGFRPRFNGRDLQGFQLVGAPASTWQVADGIIVCTGQPSGYLVTARPYRNNILRFDWRYARPADPQAAANFAGNSGLLVHITGEHKVWPKCAARPRAGS
jgi:hypothetical protein